MLALNRMTRIISMLLLLSLDLRFVLGFSAQPKRASAASQLPSPIQTIRTSSSIFAAKDLAPRKQDSVKLAASLDVDTIGLVVGQENYGLAVVCLGEAIWSFAQAPSMSQIRVLLPGALAAIILGLVSGPMVTSGDTGSIGIGLFIATAVSVALGGSYVARIASPLSDSSKEIAALGLLVSVAGFFSFGQNLVVDGFVTLPNIPLPSLPMPQGDGGVDYNAIMSMGDE